MKKLLLLGIPVLLLAYVGTASTWTVQQNEAGVRIRWGRAVGTVGGGLHITLPYPIERIERVRTTEVRTVPIGVPREEDASSFRASEESAQWLTGDTNIVELRAVVSYTVDDPIAYLYGFAAESETTHEELIRAAAESVLTRLLADTTIDSVLATGKIELSRQGLSDAQDMLERLGTGLRLSALNIAEVNPPSKVIAAFNDVSSAKADRDRLLAEAEGILGTVLPRARASSREILQSARTYANDLTSRAQGDAESFRKLATEVAKSPQAARDRLWLEAMERILGTADERIVPPRSRVYVEPTPPAWAR